MNKSKQIGLYFGSFNPIHVGHLMIAKYMIHHTPLDQVWFVVTPHNPLKNKMTLLANHHRLALVNEAIVFDNALKASDIEFKLPQPSYTVHTLAYIKEKYPDYDFSIIMGSDNLNTLPNWKNGEYIMDHYPIYVYPRKNSPITDANYPSTVHIVPAPLVEISSSYIRQSIKEGKDMRYYLPDKVYEYINEMNFYKK